MLYFTYLVHVGFLLLNAVTSLFKANHSPPAQSLNLSRLSSLMSHLLTSLTVCSQKSTQYPSPYPVPLASTIPFPYDPQLHTTSTTDCYHFLLPIDMVSMAPNPFPEMRALRHILYIRPTVLAT